MGHYSTEYGSMECDSADYFSADNLGRLSRVEEHLSYVEEIAAKYRRNTGRDRAGARLSGDWDSIRGQIDFIRRKKSDRKLNISVIGEFSTGKSTFINALLRRELLASSALQGTTVASTVIDYSECHEIELEYLDGRPGEKLSYRCFRELREALERFTTDSSVARLLKSVNVFLPAEILKNDFRIIDTPGTNVTEAWHEDVTIRALKEKSDLSIILTSAEKPVPDTMLGFVKKNLESILPQCVFVVTKLDLIRPRERERQLAYIRMKLEEELGIRDTVALPYVSPMVLGSEGVMDDGPAGTKKRICIAGGDWKGKKSLAEALMKGRVPDILKRYPAAPILKFTYGAETVVRVRLREPIGSEGDFFANCPGGLKNIIQKHNGVNLPEIEVRYTAFCELLRKLAPYQQRQDFFSEVSVCLPLESLENEYDITVCQIGELYPDPDGRKRTAADGATDIILLFHATKSWSGEEKRYVQRYGSDKRLIFAVTHMDQVREEDVPGVKAYWKRNMELYAPPDARVCYISCSGDIEISDLTEELAKEEDGDEPEETAVDEALLEMSLGTEQKLVQHTAKQRALAVTKKLTRLTDDIYQSVSWQMEGISRDYANKLARLDRSRKADLDLFVRQEKGERLQHFDRAAKELAEDMEREIYAGVAGACANVVGKLDDKDTADAIKEYIGGSLSGDCVKEAESLVSGADGYYRQIQGVFLDEMKRFHASFQKIYQSLDIIPLDLSQSKYDFPEKAAIETADIAGAANYIAERLKSENGKMLGGAAAGAAIGTAIAPGIGTVIGGVIGLFAGAPGAEQNARTRQECKDKLWPQLENYYNSVSDKAVSAVDKYIRQMRGCLSDEIDQYLKRYRSEVERQIVLENNRRSAINMQISELKADMAGIRNHKKQLESVIAQLNNLGRKEY